MIDTNNKLLILTGPTASGKTKLSLEIAQKNPAEIISADSRQVYFGLNIGTDKIGTREKKAKNHFEPLIIKNIPHYLIDILDPNESYSAGEFLKDSLEIINKIHQKNKLPIVVGGTGFYIRALSGGVLLNETQPDLEFRTWAEKQTLETLQNMLKDLSSEQYQKIDLKNKRRIMRAIEIAKNKTGKKEKTELEIPNFDVLKIALETDKENLHKKMEDRIRQQFEAGLENEARKNYEKWGEGAPGLATISYQEFFPYFKGESGIEEVKKEIIGNTWRYSKRQMTWLKKEPNIIWAKPEEAIKIIEKWTSKKSG